MKVRVYLALYVVSNGVLQIKRYTPDGEFSNLIIGSFEKRSIKARDWLEKHANPTYEGKQTKPPKGAEPYEVLYL
jgi:hypothetical protein